MVKGSQVGEPECKCVSSYPRADERVLRIRALAAALSSPTTPKQVAHTVLEKGLVAVGAQAGFVARSFRDSECEILDSLGYAEETDAAWDQVWMDISLVVGSVQSSRDAIWLDSPEILARAYPQFVVPSPIAAYDAWALLPLVVEARSIGVLGLSFTSRQTFDTDGRAFVLAIAHEAAQALARALLVEQQARLRAESERCATLFQSSDLYRVLVEGTDEYGIFMLDPEGRVASWNRGAETIIGFRPEEIIGHHFSRFFLEGDVQHKMPDEELAEAVSKGHSANEGIRVRSDGSQFWANVVVTAIRRPDGELCGFSKIIRDISRRKQSEEEQLRLLRAQEAVRARDEFLAIASHELRTPIAALKLQSQAILRQARKHGEEPISGAIHRLDSLLRQSERLTRIIEGLLDITRITSGRFVLDREEVELAGLVREAVDRWRDLLERARCELRLSAEGPVMGYWDRMRLEQIAEHLLANAAKYGAGKPVDVMVEGNETRARLVVRDQGIGIAPPDLERIFQRFERAVSSRHYGGFGLGLWIVRQIVEAHGGEIRVLSQPGQGSTFEILLPLRAETGVRSA